MGLMGDRFTGSFDGHAIELVRTNLDKQVVITVDGREIARESVALPHSWDKTKSFDVDGAPHTLTAHSMLKKMWGLIPYDNEYAIEIDGKTIHLEKNG
jgi:hypothetical protein